MKLVEKRLLAIVAIFEAVALLMLASPPSQAAIAQTPRTAPAGVQNWQVQVDNTSPAGHFWGFNAYYPEHLQAHPGDSITFTTAAMPDVYHTVTLLAARMTPLQAYSGVAGGFSFPDEDAPGEPDLQTSYFIKRAIAMRFQRPELYAALRPRRRQPLHVRWQVDAELGRPRESTARYRGRQGKSGLFRNASAGYPPGNLLLRLPGPRARYERQHRRLARRCTSAERVRALGRRPAFL